MDTMAPGHPPRAASQEVCHSTLEQENRSSKRRRASSASNQHTAPIRRPKVAKDNPSNSSTTLPTTPIKTVSPSLHAFKEANLEADKARKLQQQASQRLL